jgi:hypothetical protein
LFCNRLGRFHDQFYTEDGRIAVPNEDTPGFEAHISGTNKTVAQHPHDKSGSSSTNAARGPVRDLSDMFGADAKTFHDDGTVQRGADAMTEGCDHAQETGGRAANQTQDVGNPTDGVPDGRGEERWQALPHRQEVWLPRQ